MRKVLVVGFSVLCLAAACGLAWWQWERFSSANGSWQNLGYVLQWPLFGLAPAYMFWRLRKLKDAQPVVSAGASSDVPAAPVAEDVSRPLDADGTGSSGTGSSGAGNHGTGNYGTDDYDDDPELAEYNRYLARLARQEKR